MSKFTEFGARKLHKLYKMAQKKRLHEEEVGCSRIRLLTLRFIKTTGDYFLVQQTLKPLPVAFPEGAKEEG